MFYAHRALFKNEPFLCLRGRIILILVNEKFENFTLKSQVLMTRRSVFSGRILQPLKWPKLFLVLFSGGEVLRDHFIVWFYLFLLPSRPRKKTNAYQQNKFSSKTYIPRKKTYLQTNSQSLGLFFFGSNHQSFGRKKAPEWSRIDPSPNSVASNAQGLQAVFLPGWRFGFFVGEKRIKLGVFCGSFEVDGKMGLNTKSSFSIASWAGNPFPIWYMSTIDLHMPNFWLLVWFYQQKTYIVLKFPSSKPHHQKRNGMIITRRKAPTLPSLKLTACPWKLNPGSDEITSLCWGNKKLFSRQKTGEVLVSGKGNQLNITQMSHQIKCQCHKIYTFFEPH